MANFLRFMGIIVLIHMAGYTHWTGYFSGTTPIPEAIGGVILFAVGGFWLSHVIDKAYE